MVEKLEPPEDINHLRGRFYWSKSPKGDPFPALWKPYAWWLVLGQNRDLESHRLAGKGWTYSHPCDPNAIMLDPPTADRIATSIVREVCELPDRNSPDEQSEVLLLTCDELRTIVLAEIMEERSR